jgi:YggT family protein
MAIIPNRLKSQENHLHSGDETCKKENDYTQEIRGGSMYILGNILIGLGNVLDILLSIYMWIVIIGALISWVNPDPYNPIVRFLRTATYPLFSWLRRRLPLVIGGIDLSPIIIIAAIVFLKYALARTIIETGYRLKGGL